MARLITFCFLNKKNAAPATFQDRYELIKARRAEQVELRCLGAGELPMRIHWWKDGRRLTPPSASAGSAEVQPSGGTAAASAAVAELGEPAPTIESQLDERLGEQQLASRLRLPPLSRQHSGLYLCVAENAFGKDEKHIELLVQGKPVVHWIDFS